jgi:hypothetical protein
LYAISLSSPPDEKVERHQPKARFDVIELQAGHRSFPLFSERIYAFSTLTVSVPVPKLIVLPVSFWNL